MGRLALALGLSGLIFFSATSIASQEEEKTKWTGANSAICLAKNMYYEARNQGTAGVLAVTAVVFNRVNDPRFPNTICEVVYQGPTRESWKTRKTLDKFDAIFYPIKNRCQFSWYCDGLSDEPKDEESYQRFVNYAVGWLDGSLPFLDITDGALFYHADYVTPGWAKTKQKTVEIQDHIFYRWNIK